ncbi:MAG TPA: M13-type metalloendopeptidase [Arachnia sp.]|nr:M13-type metalloendopeptidase [Arachnia sp.]HMT86902.1 M13-type metalloendopeptidase [Arachnia sp.]
MTQALDFSHLDAAVRPQDDLYRHVNGSWLSTVVIDSDKSAAGAFIDLRDQAERDVREIVESLSADEAVTEQGKIATLYRDFMDAEKIERLGAAPLAPVLERIEAIDGPEALSAHLGWSLRHGLSSLIGFGEEADPGNPERYVLFAGQGGLGLPDEEYYRLEEHAEIRDAYLAYLTRTFELIGSGDPAAEAETVLALETKIAAHHWDKVKCRDLRAGYNPMSYDELAASAPGLDWEAFRTGGELPADKVSTVVVGQPSFATGAARLIADEPLAHWKSWARAKAVAALGAYLSSDFVTNRFDFYEKTLGGVEEQRPRWKRGVAFVEGVMGEAIGKVYVERHFRPEAKAAMDTLVANLLQAYENSIRTLTWMSEATRAEALDKLAKFRPKIGYPATWRSFEALTVVPGDLVASVLASNSFDADYSLSKVGGPVDPDEWLMYPQTVNAYYHPLRNEIVFPAAILQPPFFNAEADDAVNYGGIGSVIGHEIGHGFDDKGSTCDGDGRLRDWWTEDDRTAFEGLTAGLVKQFEALSPEGADGQRVNGELTLGENIGDLGGLGIAYDAWLLAGGDPDGEPVDGLTPAQRFFHGWAQAWRSQRRPESTKMLLAVDPHSPAEFRCNQIVRNLDAFHAAFGTQAGDALWLPSEERISIW